MNDSLLKLYKKLSGNNKIVIKPKDKQTLMDITNNLYNDFFHTRDLQEINYDNYNSYYFYISKREYLQFYELQYVVKYGLILNKENGDSYPVLEFKYASDEKFKRDNESDFNLFKRILNKYFKKCDCEIVDND